jgi:hypothetical protein
VPPERIPFDELLAADRPALLRGVARHWPLVRRGLEGPAQAAAYLKSFDGGKPILVYVGEPAIRGRFFYDEALTALNFKTERLPLSEALDRLLASADEGAGSLYIGSTDVDVYLPGLRAENDLALDYPTFRHGSPLVGAWIGNRTVASAHYDISNNLACSLIGRRRFTLFPPDQVANLYPGPLEPTPGGQVVSMVDFSAPDFERFPRFRDAIAAAEVAELEPGDVLFYPALWWHHVEALQPFNVMINYWWNVSPAFIDSPQTTLLHALLSLRNRPDTEKRAWRALFDYYIFGSAERAGAHLPPHARGDLAPMDEIKARRLRARLLQKLNR